MDQQSQATISRRSSLSRHIQRVFHKDIPGYQRQGDGPLFSEKSILNVDGQYGQQRLNGRTENGASAQYLPNHSSFANTNERDPHMDNSPRSEASNRNSSRSRRFSIPSVFQKAIERTEPSSCSNEPGSLTADAYIPQNGNNTVTQKNERRATKRLEAERLELEKRLSRLEDAQLARGRSLTKGETRRLTKKQPIRSSSRASSVSTDDNRFSRRISSVFSSSRHTSRSRSSSVNHKDRGSVGHAPEVSVGHAPEVPRLPGEEEKGHLKQTTANFSLPLHLPERLGETITRTFVTQDSASLPNREKLAELQKVPHSETISPSHQEVEGRKSTRETRDTTRYTTGSQMRRDDNQRRPTDLDRSCFAASLYLEQGNSKPDRFYDNHRQSLSSQNLKIPGTSQAPSVTAGAKPLAQDARSPVAQHKPDTSRQRAISHKPVASPRSHGQPRILRKSPLTREHGANTPPIETRQKAVTSLIQNGDKTKLGDATHKSTALNSNTASLLPSSLLPASRALHTKNEQSEKYAGTCLDANGRLVNYSLGHATDTPVLSDITSSHSRSTGLSQKSKDYPNGTPNSGKNVRSPYDPIRTTDESVETKTPQERQSQPIYQLNNERTERRISTTPVTADQDAQEQASPTSFVSCKSGRRSNSPPTTLYPNALSVGHNISGPSDEQPGYSTSKRDHVSKSVSTNGTGSGTEAATLGALESETQKPIQAKERFQARLVEKVFIICCSCEAWHSIPPGGNMKPPVSSDSAGSKSHGASNIQAIPSTNHFWKPKMGAIAKSPASQPSDEKKHTASGPMSNARQYCWCGHPISSLCCDGWTTLVHMRHRHRWL
ncbi:hypothetical protein P168DRAFT_285331 [Aspergillus campestris IBT 28561]|uniref:Uncharacterized protein n=1 Tax=Aspergillus campestris (strain IBT 28561) TaxID=1392248 RepID=A0A2I1CSQ8_ASPC2|nr:uncharacterized protein P168DRAFT_285331 [Aspergillus campestris IBT 28561]PKY00660.1 hypothetical protein P168DRAFT_285331 [Aspergillus campestris IBT 28561]